MHLVIVLWNYTFPHEATEIAVGGDVVEPVVMHTDVCDMGCHLFNRVPSADLKELLITGGIKLENRGAELEPLCPFGPASCGIGTSDGKNRVCLFQGGAMCPQWAKIF